MGCWDDWQGVPERSSVWIWIGEDPEKGSRDAAAAGHFRCSIPFQRPNPLQCVDGWKSPNGQAAKEAFFKYTNLFAGFFYFYVFFFV